MKTKRFMLALAAVILCLAVIPFSACNDNKKTELQSMKEDMIQFVANYPSEIAYPQLMTMFYQDIIDETVEKINAATSKEELLNIQSEFNSFMIANNMAYRSDRLSFELRQDTLGMCYISGTYEDKPYYVLWYLGGILSAPAVAQKTTIYYAEDPELAIKEMVITNNDVSGSEDFRQAAVRCQNEGERTGQIPFHKFECPVVHPGIMAYAAQVIADERQIVYFRHNVKGW